MSTYERKKTADVSSDKLYLADRSIYGSSRLGLEDVNLLMEYTDPLAVVTDMEELVSQKFNAGETSLGALWTRQANCGTSAVMSNVSGALQVTDICSVQYDRLFTTEIGRTYEFHADFDVSSAENLLISFHAHATGCGTSLLDQNLSVSTGHFSYSFTAISTCSKITIHNNGHSNNGGTFKVDNILFSRKLVNHQEVANKVGDKQYELANHLGNVLNVVTDRKLPFVYDSNTSGLVDYFTADVKSYSDYYPFGMQLPKRHGREGIEDYRYAFNGMEKDNEIKPGDGNSYTTEFRQYDPRIGRWLSIDPVIKEHRSPYDGFNNNPIIYVDPRGDDDYYNADGSYNRAKSKKHNKDGNNIYVLSANGKSKTLLADMPLKTTNQIEVVERVIAGYARKVGINDKVELEIGGKPSSGNPAYTWPDSKEIKVNYNGGKLSNFASNYHDFFSLLYHEKVHQDEPKGHSNDALFSGLVQHMNVYIKQFEHSDFGKTSKDFKKAMFGSYADYLNKTQAKVITEGDQKDVDKAIKKFNDGVGKKYGYEIVRQVEYDQYYNETIKYVPSETKKK